MIENCKKFGSQFIVEEVVVGPEAEPVENHCFKQLKNNHIQYNFVLMKEKTVQGELCGSRGHEMLYFY